MNQSKPSIELIYTAAIEKAKFILIYNVIEERKEKM